MTVNQDINESPIDNPETPNIDSRVDILEQQVGSLIRIIDQMSRVVAGLFENQTVAATMPNIEQQIRAQIQQRYQEGGLGALMSDQPQPSSNSTPPG